MGDGDEDHSTREFVRRGYDELGDVYDERRSASGRERAVVEAFLADLESGARLLDAGCGQGTPILQRATDVRAAGLDIARGQLEGAAEAAPSAALVQGDLAALPFATDAFDAATAFYSLIHVPRADHRTVVAELARVLRPGGELLVSEGNEPWSGTHDDWLGDGTAMTWDFAGIDATIEQLRDAGFEVLDRWDVRDGLADEDVTHPLVRARLVADDG